MNTPPEVYEWTGPTGVKFRDVREPSGTYYHDSTPRAVIEGLELALANGYRVRLWLGDPDTGRDWLEETDVAGTVGRSMGPIKIPLLLRSPRSSGGGAILCDCIVRLIVNGKEVYRHPKYHMPPLTVAEIPPGMKVGTVDMRRAGYTHSVGGGGVANFKSRAQAERWVAFMKGERGSK